VIRSPWKRPKAEIAFATARTPAVSGSRSLSYVDVKLSRAVSAPHTASLLGGTRERLKNHRHCGPMICASSEPAIASIFRERGAHGSGLDAGLEFGDQPGVSLRFPVHRVLQPVELLLEVGHTSFERLEAVRRRLARICARLIADRGETADLADPCDQSLAIAHRHRPRGRFGGAERTGKRSRSSAVIWRITSEPLSTCWRTSSCLARRCSSARRRVPVARSGQSASRLLPSPARSRYRWEIRGVGAENLTGDEIARAADGSSRVGSRWAVVRLRVCAACPMGVASLAVRARRT